MVVSELLCPVNKKKTCSAFLWGVFSGVKTIWCGVPPCNKFPFQTHQNTMCECFLHSGIHSNVLYPILLHMNMGIKRLKGQGHPGQQAAEETERCVFVCVLSP